MNTHEFELMLKFEKHSRDPSRIFFGMGEYIDSFTFIDSCLLSSFDAGITTHLELQDILPGSIRTIVRRILNAVDDNALKTGNWNQVIGIFLHNAKHSLLRWCDDSGRVTDPAVVSVQVDKINSLAERTDLHHIPSYRPYTPQMLIQGVQGLLDAGRGLQLSDTLIYRACGEEIALNRTISFSPNVLAEFMKPEQAHNRVKAVVVIKKPDYLGDSQWELRFEDRTIRAHIKDADWIASFRNRQFEIKPGDALRVILEVNATIDDNGRPQEPRYDVIEVLGIVQGNAGTQQPLI